MAGHASTLTYVAAHRARRSIEDPRWLRWTLVTIAFAFFPAVQWTGAVVMGCAGFAVAAEQLLGARRARPLVALVLAASCTAVSIGMLLAVGYGLATRFAISWLTLHEMVVTHGVLNSLGFVLLSVVGWRAYRARAVDGRELDLATS